MCFLTLYKLFLEQDALSSPSQKNVLNVYFNKKNIPWPVFTHSFP